MTIGFREIADALHRAHLNRYHIDLASGRFELTASTPEGGKPPLTIVFEGVTAFRWRSESTLASLLQVEVVGLERLGPGEPWRLYLSPRKGSELELTCGAILRDGIEVTGVGRIFRDGTAKPA